MLAWWQQLLAAGGAIACAAVLGRVWWRLPSVLRGEGEAPSVGHITVYRRSYLTFALLSTASLGGGTMILTALAIDSADVFLLGAVTLLAAMPLWAVHELVNITNRPRFLVPPSCREERGEWAAWRLRRQRTREGLPPTEHLVTINELPEDEDGVTNLCAVCDEEGCDWMEFAEDAVGAADQEHELRQQAAKHTGRTPPPVVPWAPRDAD